MKQPSKPFYESLYHLRTIEDIILYTKVTAIPAKEEEEVISFLELEYEREALEYPFTAPAFNPSAAIWGAKIMYYSSQLFIYRNNDADDVKKLISAYANPVDAGAMLSADLCLRFLPTLVTALKNIDSTDFLIEVLNNRLTQFSYSAIGSSINVAGLDAKLQPLFSNKCFRQLYINRVIEAKNNKWASIPLVKQGVLESLGDYKKVYWKDLKFEDITIEPTNGASANNMQ